MAVLTSKQPRLRKSAIVAQGSEAHSLEPV